jgi:hypothetical protein
LFFETTCTTLTQFIFSTLAVSLALNNLLTPALKLSFSTAGSSTLFSLLSLKYNFTHAFSPQVTATMFLFALQDINVPHNPRARMAVLISEDWPLGRQLADGEDRVRGREGALSEDRDRAMATVVA